MVALGWLCSAWRKEYHEITKPKVITEPTLPSSRNQQLTRPPSKVQPRDERPKPKPKRRLDDKDSDAENTINMIRQMFRFNPNNFRDDDDVSDMEANFDDILFKEERSAKIARKEDKEQLRMIEEEERRERIRLTKKKHKVSQASGGISKSEMEALHGCQQLQRCQNLYLCFWGIFIIIHGLNDHSGCYGQFAKQVSTCKFGFYAMDSIGKCLSWSSTEFS